MRHELMQFFTYKHLPEHLQGTSKLFSELAEALHETPVADLPTKGKEALKALSIHLDEVLPNNCESVMASIKMASAAFAAGQARSIIHVRDGALLALGTILRFLLEAKDCAVRSTIYRTP